MMTQELLTEIESNLKHADFRRELENLLQTTIERYSGPAFGPLTKSLIRGDPMTESAREEALRLAREAGLFETEEARDLTLEFEQAIECLIALARQRPGWVWVPREPTQVMTNAGYQEYLDWMMHSDADAANRGGYKAIWIAMLAAAPKPEDKP